MTAQPDHDDPARDARLHQNGRGHVGDRADGHDVQRIVLRPRHGPGHEIPRRGAVHRRAAVGQIALRSPEHPALGIDPQPVQQPENLAVALLHAVLRPAGAVVIKRRGVNRLHVQLLRRKQRVAQRELIVHLVVGVRVQHHVHLSLRRLKPANQLLVRGNVPVHSFLFKPHVSFLPPCGAADFIIPILPHRRARCPFPARKKAPEKSGAQAVKKPTESSRGPKPSRI